MNFLHFLNSYKDIDKGHGRLEIRKCYSSNNINWLEEREEWPGLKNVFMIKGTRIVGEKEATERSFYISSLEPDPEQLIKGD